MADAPAHTAPPFRNVDEVLELIHGVAAIITRRNIDSDTFSFVSEGAGDLLGHPLERWLSEPGFWLKTVVHPRERGRVESLFGEALAGGGSVMEYRARRADGETLWVREHVHVTRVDGSPVVGGVMVDVTDQRRAMAVAERSYRSLELLKDIADDAIEASSGVGALRATLPRLTRFLGMSVGHAFVRDPSQQRLVPLSIWHAEDERTRAFREATERADLRFSEGLVGRAAAVGEPLWLDDVTRSSLFLRGEAARASGLRCGLALPVLAGERTAAVLEFYGRGECPYDDALHELLATVGGTLGRAFEREWAERDRRERELNLREAQVTARLGGWVWDTDGDALVLSDELREVLGMRARRMRLSADEVLELLRPEDRDGARAALEGALRDGRPFEQELRVRQGERGEVHLHVRARITEDATGARRVYGTAQDVTAHRRAEATERELLAERRARQHAEAVQARLVRTAEALARSNRQLDEFAYVASHDLKAPLRGIANLVRYLEEDLEDRLTAETRGYMELVQTRVRWMQELIDGILTFSRAGREQVPATQVEVAAMVGEVVGMLPEGPDVTIEVAPDAHTLTTPVAPLRQVLLNLIANAFRFADAADPRVLVRVEPHGGDMVRVRVQDNGAGIAPEFQDRIWGIFQTLQARDDGGGSGIGLAVVRKLVEQHGGKAWVESRAGAGATFLFTWPRHYDNDQETQR